MKFLLPVLLLPSLGFAGTAPALDSLNLLNTKAVSLKWKHRGAVQVADAAPELDSDLRLAVIKKSVLGDGVIEATLAGELAPGAGEAARGFVGVAFHVSEDASKFECFYLRPTNGRSEDQVRRNHSTQYISSPDFPWYRLRKEFPEKYESYADIVPGEWTRIRIEIKGTNAKLFVNGATQPALVVSDLKLGAGTGAVALWVGPGTVAQFTDIRITPLK